MKNFIFSVILSALALNASAQNVGVGITTPLYKLHVHGDVYVNSSQGSYILGYPGADYKWRLATTNGGQDLLIRSEDPAATATTRMYFSQSGLIGLGTSTPGSSLDVKSPNAQTARFNGPASNMYVSILENDVYRGYFGSYSGANEDVDFGTGGGTTGKVHLVIAAAPKLTIDNAGEVGIGTTNPTAKLEVITSSSSSTTQALLMKNSIGDTILRLRNNGSLGIAYNGNNTARPLNVGGNGANFWYDEANLGGAIYPRSDGSIVMWSNSSGTGQNVILQPSWGSVTIGTYTPATGYKLSVYGKAICEELKVQLNGSWPDYVFDNKYALLPLDELEQKVMEQKHLPGIMPASVVELNNGFEVGDMQKRVVEKVEELYRYMFDMNRENKALKAQVESLTNKLQLLEEKDKK